MALFSLFAVVAHEVVRGDLEAELGTRLSALASSAALHIRGKYLVDLGPGDEDDRAYQNARRKLDAVARDTGAARIYVFDRELESRVDTADDVPIHSKYFQAELDRHELGRVFTDGVAVSSVLFEGEDGTLYRAGYAPVRASESEDEIVLALGVQAPAAYFARLADLRRSLFFYGVVLALVVMVISVVVAALITRPVRHLVGAAERIGRGDLRQEISRSSRDEIGFLAESMDEMRRDLKARDERMQLMLAGIAHEVRNPLGGIELYTGILRDELDADDERLAYVLRIERELGYLATVVSDFLEYARRPAPEMAMLDMAEIAAEVVDLARADAAAAGVGVVLQAEPTPCRGDAGQLRRAMLNLVQNAVQASVSEPRDPAVSEPGDPAVSEPGEPASAVRVVVRPWDPGGHRGEGGQCSTDASGAEVRVKNRGAPIPDDICARIFEPFFTTRAKGTGLGLAFVREIVADHHGHITLSHEDGETELRVRIP